MLCAAKRANLIWFRIRVSLIDNLIGYKSPSGNRVRYVLMRNTTKPTVWPGASLSARSGGGSCALDAFTSQAEGSSFRRPSHAPWYVWRLCCTTLQLRLGWHCLNRRTLRTMTTRKIGVRTASLITTRLVFMRVEEWLRLFFNPLHPPTCH